MCTNLCEQRVGMRLLDSGLRRVLLVPVFLSLRLLSLVRDAQRSDDRKDQFLVMVKTRANLSKMQQSIRTAGLQ